MHIEADALERRVMEMLLAGDDPILSVLREQFQVAHVAERTLTGAGFFVTYLVPPTVPRLEGSTWSYLGHVKADIRGLQHGAGFVLHLRDGAIDYLEGYCYDEPWPTDVDTFSVSYIEDNERDLATLWRKWAG